MSKVSGTVRRRVSLGVLFAGLMLALALPVSAFAANTATFSSAAPKAGSASTAAMPKISVVVYDKYGVKGSASYSMTIDGKTVKPTISYVSGYGYKKFRLTYTLKAPLTIAPHVVIVKVKDLKKKSSTYSWRFTVLDGIPPVTTSDAALNYQAPAVIHLTASDNVGVAGTYYKLDGGPEVDGDTILIDPPVKGVHTIEFWSEDAQGNEEAHHSVMTFVTPRMVVAHNLPSSATCVISGCHSDDVSVIHDTHLTGLPAAPSCLACHIGDQTPTAFCTDCHGAGGSADAIPANHSAHASTVTTGSFTILSADYGTHACAECHDSMDLQVVHGGANSCATCHPDPVDSASGRNGGCATGNCHAGTSDVPMHGSINTAHTLASAPSCIATDCHVGGTSVVAIHAAVPGRTDTGCGICHGDGKTPTLVCSTAGCHSASDSHPVSNPHPTMAAGHTAGLSTSCVTDACHSSANLPTIHEHALGCATCHGAGKTPTKDCSNASCHPTYTNTASHTGFTTAHALDTTPSCVAANCHNGGANAAAIHPCAACHAAGKPPLTLDCATVGCHSDQDAHPVANPHRAMTSGHTSGLNATCVAAGCHQADLTLIHAPALGCATCHFSDKIPTKVCATAGCHPAISGVSTHPNLVAKHSLDTTPSCAVAGCHAGGTDVRAIHAPLGCATCHADGKPPLTLVCATVGCHSDSDSHPASNPHPSMTAAHTVGLNATCVKPGCHVSDLSVIHSTPTTNHPTAVGCVACHGDGKTPTQNCQSANCHPTITSLSSPHPAPVAPHTSTAACVNPGCHISNVALVHVKNGVSSCFACHADGVTPSTDCATCHTGSFAPHTDKATVHTALTNSCDSSSACHSKNVLTIHGGRCFACHAAGKVPSTTCLLCHADQHSQQAASHETTPGVAISCGGDGCHADVSDLATIHAGTPLKCKSCHDDNPAHTASGVCSDCHGTGGHIPLHDVVRTDSCVGATCHAGTNLTTIHAAVGCAACHKNTDSNVVAAIAGENKACLACHTGHDLPALHASGLASMSDTITIPGVDPAKHACSDCHTGADLRTLHGENGSSNSCAKCHTTSVATTLGGTWAKGCVQGNCHAGTSTVPMHGNLGTAHAGVVDGCTATGCHTGGTNVASIHAAVPHRSDSGCGICHGSGALTATPTTVCSTAACHPDGAPSSHAGHQSTQTTGTITITGVGTATHSCNECHSTMDLQQVPQHGGCASCHPTPANSAAQGVFTCAQGNCHAGTSPIKMHASVDTTHTGVVPGCTATGCHTGGTNVAAIHSVVPHRSDSGCGICHGSGALTATPTTVCATAACHPTGAPASHSSHLSTQTTGTITINSVDYTNESCSMCHSTLDLQQISAHGACTTCHPSPANSAAQGVFTCAQGNCHAGTSPIKMHASVDTTHTGVVPGCTATGCHTGGTNVASIHAAVPHRSDNGCGICHGSGALTATPTTVCSTGACHPTGAPASHSAHLSTQTTGTITINSVDYTNESCSMCHSTLDLQQIPQHTNCATCHPTPANSAATGVFTCAQGNCHAGTSTVKIHASVDTTHTGVVPGCTATGCHTGGTNVATIHSVVPGRSDHGCGICHGSGAVTASPTVLCATVGCHPTGAPSSHAGHLSTQTTGTITITGVGTATYTCSQCHSTMDLQQVPQHTSCATCHPTPADSAAHGVFTCAQGNCHAGTSPIKMHASVDTTHTGVVAGCTAAGCHTGGTNVAAIHSVVPGRSDTGCGICHGSGAVTATPTTVCATAGCHPTGAPSSHAGHLSTQTTGTITLTGLGTATYTCSMCHTTMDLQQIPQHTNCATCHPNPANSAAHGVFTCAQGNCHAGTSTVKMHASVDTTHTGVVPGCTTGSACHTGGSNVALIHSVVPGRSDTGCGICHGSGAFTATPTTVCATVGCHPTGAPASHAAAAHQATLTTGTITINGTPYTNQTCSSCHASTELQAVHGETGSNNSCAKCHPAPANTIGHNNWNGTCTQVGCHVTTSGNMKAIHASADASHTLAAIPTDCVGSGCHTAGASGKDVAALHSVANGGPGCICHQAGKTLTLTCAAAGCHPSGAPADHSSGHTGTTTSAGLTVSGVGTVTHACNECHATMNLQTIHGGSTGCSNCHPAPANTIGHNNWTGACNQGGCHTTTTSTMKTMHASIDTSHVASAATACESAGCHSGGTNIALVHNVAQAPAKCATCHNTSTTATLNCTKAGCHGTNDSVYATSLVHKNEDSGHAQGVSDNCNNCHDQCSDCHGGDYGGSLSGDLAGIHSAQGYNCTACHTPGTTNITDCANCHDINGMTNDWNWMD